MREEREATFEIHRPLLEGLAYRMCGVLADAQDLVQETYLRWNAADSNEITNPRAWLVTVCTRLSMDFMKSARVQREQYVGAWLPEPFLETSDPSPDVRTQIDDSVSVALMLALERLTPTERAAFLLHDVFGYDFEEVASIIGKSAENCRKSASRARTAIREKRPRFNASPETHRRLLNAFLRAVQSGDANSLKSVLTDSIEFHADGGGMVKTAPDVLRGRAEVAAFFLHVWKEDAQPSRNIHIVERWFNGQPGILIDQDGQLRVALSATIEEGQITQLFALRNPEKLKAFAVPPRRTLGQPYPSRLA